MARFSYSVAVISAIALLALTSCRPKANEARSRTLIGNLHVGSGRRSAATVEGVVTFHDSGSGRLYIEDATGGVKVEAVSRAQYTVYAGQKLSASGLAVRLGPTLTIQGAR